MTANFTRRYLECWIFGASVLFSVVSLAPGQDDSAASLWPYYPPIQTSSRQIVPADREYRAIRPHESQYFVDENETLNDRPVEESSDYAGFSSHLDREFDREPKPSWTPQTIEKPMITRPSYDYPGYDAPLVRFEPVNKVKIDRPAYVAPEADRPNYKIDYDEAPAEVAPTLAAPAYEGPNYVVKPYQPPAINAPVIDHSSIDYRPEAYKAPVYQPQEYRPPRELPPQYLPPPEG